MTLEKWLVIFVTLIVICVMLFLCDIAVAGIFWFITLMFQPVVSNIVFTWVFIGMAIIEVFILPFLVYGAVKDRLRKDVK